MPDTAAKPLTREQHLEESKKKALAGDWRDAWTVFYQLMKQHPETAKHPRLVEGLQKAINDELNTRAKMRRWITNYL